MSERRVAGERERSRPPHAPFLVALLLGGAAVSVGQTGHVVIINAGNKITQVSKAEVARIFLKQTQTWPDGTPVSPVDLTSTSATRQLFTHEVLGMTTGTMRDYWLKQTYSGNAVPPRVKDDEPAVIAFVGSQPGAIGYVSAGTALPPAVKALRVEP